MNNHLLKITGVSELPNQLELGESYTFLLNADVIAIKKEDENDGTFTFTYSAKQTTGEIKDKLGKVVKFQDKKSQSKKLRSQLVAISLDRGLEPEKFYHDTMVDFRHFTLEILDFISSLKK